MRKRASIFLVVVLLTVLVCPRLLADEDRFLSTVSPNLRKFLTEHPVAMKALTNAFATAFSNRTVRLYYFYSSDPAERGAFHYYPNVAGMADVFIGVKHDSPPLDEFLCVLYETLNSKGEKRFEQLTEQAKAGSIGRTEFARAVLGVEFEAVKNTRQVLGSLQISKKESAKATSYQRFAAAPLEFEAFLEYQKTLFPPHHSPFEEYQSRYDWLRQHPH